MAFVEKVKILSKVAVNSEVLGGSGWKPTELIPVWIKGLGGWRPIGAGRARVGMKKFGRNASTNSRITRVKT